MNKLTGCLSLLLICAVCALAQDKNNWIVTPPRTTYPANPWTTAVLKASDPTAGASLVLRTKQVSVYQNGESVEITRLEIYIDVGEQDLSIVPEEWGKVCEKVPTRGGLPAHKNCTTGMVHDAGVKIDFSFDNDKPIHDLWNAGTGAAFFPSANGNAIAETEFLNKLRSSKHLTIRYYPKDQNAASASFDLTGANEILDKLCQPECNL